MVTYSYECAKCGVFVWKQPITDNALNTCPYCGGQCKRVLPGRMPDVWWVGWPYEKENEKLAG